MGITSDMELIEDALRDLAPGQCVSVIVGTDASGKRDIHPCVVQAMHGHKTHRCGCGCRQSWRYLIGGERWSDVGPLTNVVHAA